MLDSAYLYLTCVKNNAIGLIKKEFLNDKDWYRLNCHKIHPSAIYLCLLFGHNRLLKLLLDYMPLFNLNSQITNLTYAIDVAIAKGHYESVLLLMEYLNK